MQLSGASFACCSAASTATRRASRQPVRVLAAADPGSSYGPAAPRSPAEPSTVWGPRSDLVRPSGGASRGAIFAAAVNPDNSLPPSTDRPGGRGGGERATFSPAGGSSPLSSIDRPGGRGGGERAEFSAGSASSSPLSSIDRPGGRGGGERAEFAATSGAGGGGGPVNVDRPGGRGGRDGLGGNDGGSGGSGSGAGGESGSGGGSGIGLGQVALYAGVCGAAWMGYNAMHPAPAPEPVKPCCAGKGKKK